ncbi:neprilysin-1-like [Dermacentor variabilis]|uniref:neprilysin-1-like n=1 Tax=Dermacentor variabilis TaxID=34621 RepID=UPI003F5C6F00
MTFPDGGQPVCRTFKCKKRAQLISNYIDKDVSPCEDFFSYACGTWIKKNEKKNTPRDALERIRQEFVKALARILNATTTSGTGNSVTDKATMLYKACMGVPNGNQKEDVKDIVRSAGFDNWPIIMTNPSSEALPFNTYSDVIGSVGISPIIKLLMGRGINEVDRNVIKVITYYFMI